MARGLPPRTAEHRTAARGAAIRRSHCGHRGHRGRRRQLVLPGSLPVRVPTAASRPRVARWQLRRAPSRHQHHGLEIDADDLVPARSPRQAFTRRAQPGPITLHGSRDPMTRIERGLWAGASGHGSGSAASDSDSMLGRALAALFATLTRTLETRTPETRTLEETPSPLPCCWCQSRSQSASRGDQAALSLLLSDLQVLLNALPGLTRIKARQGIQRLGMPCIPTRNPLRSDSEGPAFRVRVTPRQILNALPGLDPIQSPLPQ